MSQSIENHLKKWPKSVLRPDGIYTSKIDMMVTRDIIHVAFHVNELGELVYNDPRKPAPLSTISTKTFQEYEVHADSVEEAVLRVESDAYEVLPSILTVTLHVSTGARYVRMYLRKWSPLELANFKLGDICD